MNMPNVIAYVEGTLSVCGVFVFVILFIMIHAALEHSKMFSGWTTSVLSFCVTSLSMIAMRLMFVPGQSRGIPLILIPYGLLGLFLLIMFLMMLITRRRGSDKTDNYVKELISPVWTPPGKRTKPVIPPDLPPDLDVRSPLTSHVSTDCLNRASRDLDSTKHLKANRKPSKHKGTRYEK